MLQQGFGRSAEQSHGLRGDIRLKSGPYCCMAGDLARADQAQLSKIYCHKRGINLARRKVCSVYHMLRKYTHGDSAVYLHRAGPRAMGHRRCLKGYDRASKYYSEKQRGTVLSSETMSLVSCHMTYKPPQADSPESYKPSNQSKGLGGNIGCRDKNSTLY